MYRRIVLGALAAAVLVLAGWGGLRSRAADADKDAHHAELEKCARACCDCTLACASCFKHCMTMVAAGHKDHVRTMQTCNDCSDFCAMTAKVVNRSGPMVGMCCDTCAKVCESCGKACEKFPDDEHMVACAKACKECMMACREMLKHVGNEESGGEK
jgi:hypothetical protein